MTFQQFAINNVFRNFRNYAAFFMASFFSVFVFFIYSMLVFHPEIERGFLGELPIVGMILAEIVLVLFSWFFIFYSMRAFLSARSKEFAILLHLGIERKQLNKLVMLETTFIGLISSITGIIFGFAFSKFFFLIVREILNLEDLPLYFSWEPFVLTFVLFLTTFVIIAYISVTLTDEPNLVSILKGKQFGVAKANYSKFYAILGIALILSGYMMALAMTKSSLILFSVLIPIVVTFGTYYFFMDSTHFLLDLAKRKKTYYWRKSRLLSIAEQSQILQTNAKMFFIVTLVSTLAFLTVGILSVMSSYTSQYDKINPIGMIYKGFIDNPYEGQHITMLLSELEEQGLSYEMSRFAVKRQTSTHTNNIVEVFRESDINNLLFSFSLPMVQLDEGEAMFIAHSEDALTQLQNTVVHTVLKENSIPIKINNVYPETIFPTAVVSNNSIIVSDDDYVKIVQPYEQFPTIEPGYHLFTFNIPNWIETKEIGLAIQRQMAEEYLENPNYTLPFYFENTGLNYSYILATYSLFTLVGILVVAVFLLAAGSFIYFKLYANLDRETKQFQLLKRIGLTDKEMKKLVTSYLIPQFFLPWGLAFIHSIFTFLAVQEILRDAFNISIVREVVFSFSIFTCIQIVYFFLIRWRYIAHIRA